MFSLRILYRREFIMGTCNVIYMCLLTITCLHNKAAVETIKLAQLGLMVGWLADKILVYFEFLKFRSYIDRIFKLFAAFKLWYY